MPSTVQSIALFTPIIASNAVFSARRANRGVEAMNENPVYAAMNIDIAAAQVVKGGRAVQAVAAVADPAFEQTMKNTTNAIKNSGKFLRGTMKVLDFTADHINPIICVTSGIKVLNSDDKLDCAAREVTALTSMFAFEGAAKHILGMPYTKKVNGKNVTFQRQALYKKSPFVEKQVAAMKDYCATKKLFNKISLKAVPGALKGLGFVFASIAGYKLGMATANAVLGEQKTN